MSLTDQNTGMMDRLGQSKFEDLSLETTFQEIFDSQTQNVIELHAGFIQYSDTDQTTNECVTWKGRECVITGVLVVVEFKTPLKELSEC